MKRLRAAALGAFAAQFGIADAILRRPPLRVWLPSALASAAVWLVLASLARRRAARVAVALVAAWLLVVQILFFRYYHVFLDDDAVGAARHMWADAKPVVMGVLPMAAAAAMLVTALEYTLVAFAPKVRPRNAGIAGALGAVCFALGPPWRDASPDVEALWSLRVLARAHEARAASSVTLPALPTKRARLPNVLFVLTESVRASDYQADDAPRTAELTQGRIDFAQMRSVASYTAIAVSSLLTSRPPIDAEKQRESEPDAFDFVRAVRHGEARPRVVYWSAQTDSLFERHDVRAVADSFSTVDDLVGHKVEDIDDVVESGVDRLLAAKVEAELPKIEKPFFVTLHLSGTHAPYFVDDASAPYRPYRHTVTWAGLPELHNAYRDAIRAQDESVARMLRAFFAAVGSEPWVIVFTSDHGEAFGEHKAIHHGQSLYDEQTHVPGWLLAGNGALDDGELRALRSHATESVTHLDFVPTLLDVYGVLDAFPMAGYRRLLGGRSLLREGAPPTALPMTNCTDMFPCPVRTWGVLGPDREITAQPWDAAWVCVDLRGSIAPSDDPACAALRASSHAWFPALPNGAPN